MTKHAKYLAIVIGLAGITALSAAFSHISYTGRWSPDWPEQLEPLRERASTSESWSGLRTKWHTIPFDDRDEFEKLWPTIRDVVTDGAPIYLDDGPIGILGRDKTWSAGVCISEGEHQFAIGKKNPETGEYEKFEAKRPWPKRFFDANGVLHPFVVLDETHNRWEPLANSDGFSIGVKIRTDIILYVDGDVIDLSRIELPENSEVIDRRKSVKEPNPER